MPFDNYPEKQYVSSKTEAHAAAVLTHSSIVLRKKILAISFLMMIFMLYMAGPFLPTVCASGVTVAWDIAAEPDIETYKILYGTASGSYSNSVSVANPQDNPGHIEQSVAGLTQGRRYYFSVKAVDAAGQESDAADEADILIPYGFDGSDLAAHMDDIEWLETGKAEVGSEWITVTLSRHFAQPVVIVSPASASDGEACVVRVTDVTDSSFSMRIQEWDYLDGTHETETVSYIVIEAGVYEMPDGTIWQAGTFELSGIRKFTQTDFPALFNTVPVVFQTVQTDNESDTVSLRAKNITESGFSSALDEQESLRDDHTVEITGYLAVEKNLEGDHVIDTTSATDKLFIPSGTEGVYLKLEEEQSRDDETAHTTETIGYMQIGDLILAQIQTYNGGDTSAMRVIMKNTTEYDDWYNDQEWIEVGSVNVKHEWITVTLQHSFDTPVVITGPPTRSGSDPCLVRIRNITADSFEIRLQEWNYNNGAHVTETVSWMVIEAGIHELPDGTIWEAGLYDMDGTGQWQTISMNHDFGMPPVILQAVQSENEDHAVATRLTSIAGSSFSSAFQEEEALNDGHALETVGYLAASITSPCDIGLVSLNHSFTRAGDQLTELMVEEEKSKDSEMSHVYENIGYLELGSWFFGQIQTFNGSDTAVLRMR